jgi:glutathione S-transferase
MQLTLISHTLCPYVQRAAIVLAEKEVAFERRYVDLANKPDWFKAVSPLGKTPVLMVDDDAIFESAVICEYLDDTLLPRLHPADALKRAQHRAWMEFGSGVLNTIAAFYNAPDAAAFTRHRESLQQRFSQLEAVLPEQGTLFRWQFFQHGRRRVRPGVSLLRCAWRALVKRGSLTACRRFAPGAPLSLHARQCSKL